MWHGAELLQRRDENLEHHQQTRCHTIEGYVTDGETEQRQV
jgi:hypothetical protein